MRPGQTSSSTGTRFRSVAGTSTTRRGGRRWRRRRRGTTPSGSFCLSDSVFRPTPSSSVLPTFSGLFSRPSSRLDDTLRHWGVIPSRNPWSTGVGTESGSEVCPVVRGVEQESDRDKVTPLWSSPGHPRSQLSECSTSVSGQTERFISI